MNVVDNNRRFHKTTLNMDGRMILKSLLKTKDVWERVRINSIRTGPAAS